MNARALHVGVPDQDLAALVQEGNHSVTIFHLVVQFRVLDVHLLGSKEARSDRVMSMLQMLLLLVTREEAPAQQACAQLVRTVIIHLKLFDERFELIA